MKQPDLRDAFEESVVGGKPDIALAEGLRQCTDIMPSALCNLLEMESGSTYAEAARKVSRAADAALRVDW